jgi:threonylcarbamoyladenosine tRNA methylthiotransferase CDKAL1
MIKVYTESAAQGCLTNLMETTTIRKSLDGDCHSCENPADADVIIINTCGYSQSAEANSVEVIRNYELAYPGKKIIAAGCLPRINNKALQNITSVGDLKKLGEHVSLKKEDELIHFDYSSEINPAELNTRRWLNRLGEKLSPFFQKLHHKFGWPNQVLINIFESIVFDNQTYAITVSTGCLGKCTYCAIKKAKGSLISRPLDEIIPRIQYAITKGYKRVHLLADDVGCWGQDIGLNSAVLLKEIFKIQNDFKIIIDYFDPTWLVKHFDELKAPLADKRMICINVPIQSGNNRVLKEMSRDYNIKNVMDCLAQLKRVNPELAIKTHIMTGYPGEMRNEFLESLEKLIHFDIAFPNRYSPRPGTPAAKLEEIPRWKSWLRFQILTVCIHVLHFRNLLRSIIFLKVRS